MEEKKEKVIVFFCDIEGTIDTIDEEKAAYLKEMLEIKRKYYGADKVIISLITGDSVEEYLNKNVKLVESKLSTDTIIMGDHYFLYGALINGKVYNCHLAKLYNSETLKDPENNEEIPFGFSKPEKMLFYMDKIYDKYEILHSIYADDYLDNNIRAKFYFMSEFYGLTEFKTEFFSQNKGNLSDEENTILSDKLDIDFVLDCFKKSNSKDNLFWFLDEDDTLAEKTNDVTYQMKPPEE